MIDHTFSQLINLEQVRELLESHNRLSRMAYGLFDAHENNLIAVGWQDICIRFHRANPITCAYCRESDAFIKDHLLETRGEPLEYRCKNNMIDVAMPIIIEGKHLGTFFTGQFFYDDAPPDREYFVKQARALGFDEKAYLDALDRVPLLSHEHIRYNVIFLHNMVQMLAEMGLKNLRLAHETEERRHAEDDLRRLTSFQRTILEHVTYGIISTTPDGVVTSFNSAAVRLLGYTTDEVVGKQAPAYWHDVEELARRARELSEELGEPVAAGFEVFTAHPQRNLPEENEWTFIRKDGKRIPVYLSVTALRNEGGQITGFVGLFYDLTERKRDEEEKRTLNQALEQRVAERTAQLESAIYDLENFNYSASHDLRIPLRAIDGFSKILLDEHAGKLDDEAKRLLNIVRSNTVRMSQYIDDMLIFSRTGRTALTSEEIDMEELAREVMGELKPAGAEIELDIRSLPRTVADRAMMRQVFVCLLSNAVKFSRPRKSPRIEVGASIEGGEIIYYVKDNGVGFDMRYVGKLFGVFERLHSVTEFEGNGIGLAIFKRIVSRHGGRVWAEGKINEGATVYFALPIKEKDHG